MLIFPLWYLRSARWLLKGKEAPVDSIWIHWRADAAISILRLVKCSSGKHTRKRRPVALLLFESTVVCLQGLKKSELDLLEHISSWELCKLTVRKLICAEGESKTCSQFKPSTSNDESINCQWLKRFCFLSAASENATIRVHPADKICSVSVLFYLRVFTQQPWAGFLQCETAVLWSWPTGFFVSSDCKQRHEGLKGPHVSEGGRGGCHLLFKWNKVQQMAEEGPRPGGRKQPALHLCDFTLLMTKSKVQRDPALSSIPL